MNELRTLLSLELRSLYGINRFLHTRDKKEKNRYRLLLAAFGSLIATVFAYVAALVYGLCSLGLQRIVPAYLAVLSSLLIIAFGIFTAGHRIFSQRGYDLLSSMPLRPGAIVTSRFLGLYAEDLILTLLILLPGAVTYGICLRPGPGFYLAALLGSLFLPAIPLVVSVSIGTLVTAAASRMKYKSALQSILMVGLVIAILLASFSLGGMAESFSPEAFAELANTLSDLFSRLYPPALWFGNALLGDAGGLLLLVLLSTGLMALAVGLVSKYFHPISRRLQSFSAKHDYKISAMESRGLLKALYLREARRYFSSSIYVTNTIVGPILGAIMAVALCVTGTDSIQAALPVDITVLLPFAFSGVFCMMTTSCTSVSMEGRQFWVVKSLPIPTKALLDSKLLLNLSLMLPFYIVSVIAMAIATRPGPLALLWLICIPASISLFSVIFGITVNLKFHSFDWEKEEVVVKQSLPAALGGFSGFLLSAGLGIAVFLLPASFRAPAMGLTCLLLPAASYLLYRKNNQTALSSL